MLFPAHTRSLFALLCLTLPLTAPFPAVAAEFSIDADYPGGNILIKKIEGDQVLLAPDLRDTAGWWFYWNFRVTGAAGRTVTFQFDGQSPIGVRGPAISQDGGATWAWMGAECVTKNSFDYTFSADACEVRFAFTIPYLQSDLDAFLKKHEKSSFLSVTTLCATGKNRSVEKLHIGNLEGDPRFRVLITARHHACEAMANFVLEGLTDVILADTEDGCWFGRNVELTVIPFMDKDGVEDGDQGKNRTPRDHNRDYIGVSVHKETEALRTFVPNWANGKLRVALDLHCPHIRGRHNEDIYIVGSRHEEMWVEEQRFGSLLEEANRDGLLPYSCSNNLPHGKSWNVSRSYSAGLSFDGWASGLDGIQLATAFEIPYANAGGTAVTPENSRNFGSSLAKALRAYLQEKEKVERRTSEYPVFSGGVFPSLTVMAQGKGSTSEAGIGALIPWGNRLWAVGYVAHINGQGLGLYEIRENMTMERHPASITGTYANRMAHWPSGQAFIGPYAIDADGQVRTIEAFREIRLAATCAHLTDPRNKVYFLGMEGGFWEVDVKSLEAVFLFDLKKELGLQDVLVHFKSAHTAQGRVVVANNNYDEQEYLGLRQAGRLAEWDGSSWNIVERNPFVEVAGTFGNDSYGGDTLYALGWTDSSLVLRVLVKGEWRRYLLPKSSQCWDHAWNTEWMRIRHASTERLMMDAHGTFFELPPFAYGGEIWGIRPVCTHLRVVPDYCHWRGFFVMASDQIDHDQGQPQSGLWFGNIDDLWSMGKPSGWGGPWRNTALQAGDCSDPYLMTGYDAKGLHLHCQADEPVRIDVEVDFLGNRQWVPYHSFELTPGQTYRHHEFPAGFSAHWVRLRVNQPCTATAQFFYN